jgi:hypothetical protein
MPVLDLGLVIARVEVLENTFTSYRLRVHTNGGVIDTPNLRGAAIKTVTVEVLGHEPLIVPFTDIGLKPEKNYLFYAAAGVDYPYLRNINAVRIGNTVQVSVYYDTVPYTVPQQGSPFDSGFVKIGAPGLKIGGFRIGEQFDGKPFPVNLFCLEIVGTEETGDAA